MILFYLQGTWDFCLTSSGKSATNVASPITLREWEVESESDNEAAEGIREDIEFFPKTIAI